MDLGFDDDTRLLVEELERIAAQFAGADAEEPAYHLASPALEAVLRDGGFLEIATSGFGLLGASLLIDAVGRTPFAVELVGAVLMAPLFGLADAASPLAIIDAARPGPVRFLRAGGRALVDAGDHVRFIAHVSAEPVDSFVAYPFGRLIGDAMAASTRLPDAPIDRFRHLRRLGVAAEISAAMQQALALTVDYARERVQFGKPIGAFQAVAHRLAECATVADGVRWLVRRAAASERPGDALTALAYAQHGADQLIWETNQLHGAVALTLEYPAHYWNYRLRVLQAEMGGPATTLAEMGKAMRPACDSGTERPFADALKG